MAYLRMTDLSRKLYCVHVDKIKDYNMEIHRNINYNYSYSDVYYGKYFRMCGSLLRGFPMNEIGFNFINNYLYPKYIDREIDYYKNLYKK